MLHYRAAKDRAVKRAVETGDMANMDLIHAMQRSEGYEACFGRATDDCSQTHCRWFEACMALADYTPRTTQRSMPAETLTLPQLQILPDRHLKKPAPQTSLVCPDPAVV